MAGVKSVYLVCGDDDAKIDAWRARVRRRAEEERGPGGLEAFDASQSSPAEVAAALAALTFDTGTRYLLVDDAAVWKAADLGPLEAALRDPPPETILVLIVRGKPLKALRSLAETAGGELREYAAPKAWELPRWVRERARELELQLDNETARALIGAVGSSQQRLSRELEKLALAIHPRTRLSLEDVDTLTAGDGAPRAFQLADALVAGDLAATLRLAEELRAHGERPGGLVWGIARRLREVHLAAALLDAGMSEQQAGEAVERRPWLAKRIVAQAKKADRAAIERALCALADLEIDLRGGADAALDEDAALSLTLARAAR